MQYPDIDFQKEFSDYDGYSSHRPLLYQALKNTYGLVVEFGSGLGSTLLLAEYCKRNERQFLSFESNSEWYDKMRLAYPELLFVPSWVRLSLEFNKIGLLFIDHAPGERRKIDIAKYKTFADVILAHDTEASADYGYKMSGVLSTFAFRKDFKPEGFAHSTAVSDTIDVSKWSDA